MRYELLQATKLALHGSRKIKIVFKQGREGWDALYSLLGMEKTGLVSLPPIQSAEYYKIYTLPPSSPTNPTDKWNEYWAADVRNRTITIQLNEVFVNNYKDYVNWFRDRLYESVESVEVIE